MKKIYLLFVFFILNGFKVSAFNNNEMPPPLTVVYTSTDVPKTIDSVVSDTITSILTIPDFGTITSIKVLDLELTHTYIENLIIILLSPDSTSILLLNQPCGDHDDINVDLEDGFSGIGTVDCTTSPVGQGNTYQPEELLSTFNGENINGNWTLIVQDVVAADGGSLDLWKLEITFDVDPVGANAHKNNTTCFGVCDGSILVTPKGGIPPYNFLWSNGATSKDVSGLCPGTYSVSISDTNGDTAVIIRTVDEPDEMTLSIDSTDVTCNGATDGGATITVNNGVNPVNFLWSNGATTAVLNGLGAGVYTVTATDSLSCVAMSSTTINEPTSNISVNMTDIDLLCFGASNGSATANVSGGTPPYNYTWSNGGTSATITGLVASVYSVTIIDANGCKGSNAITLTQPPEIQVNDTIVNVGCFGANNGSIILSSSGGTGGYSYEWNTGSTSDSLLNVGFGTYLVTITDSLGCKKDLSYSVSQPPILSLPALMPTNTSCFGGCDGSIEANVSGGVPPYNYYWSNGETTKDVFGLCEGSYSLVAVDSNSCSITDSVDITEPLALVLSINPTSSNCGTNCTGMATVDIDGGSAPYSYQWSDAMNQTTQTANNLCSGNYTVTVTDVKGCTITSAVSVEQNFPPPELSFSGEDQVCSNAYEEIYGIPTTTGSTYSWTLIGGNGADEILYILGDKIAVHWKSSNTTAIVRVIETNIDNCTKISDYNVTISADVAPDVGEALRFPNTSTLVYAGNNTTGLCYQWGCTDANDVESTFPTGTNRVFTPPNGINPTKTYWVETFVETGGSCDYQSADCITRSYFDRPLPTNISEPHTDHPKFFVFPNPNSGEFNIRIDNANSGAYSISVYNAIGQVVFHIPSKQFSGFETFPVKLEESTKGLFLIEMKSEEGTSKVQKINVY